MRRLRKKSRVVVDFSEQRRQRHHRRIRGGVKEAVADEVKGKISDAVSGLASDETKRGVKRVFKHGGTAVAGPVGTIVGAQVGEKVSRDLDRSQRKGEIDRKRFRKRYKKERRAGKRRRDAVKAAGKEVAKKSMKTWKTMRKAEKWRAKHGKGQTFAGKVVQGLKAATPGYNTWQSAKKIGKAAQEINRAAHSRSGRRFRHQSA